MTRLGPTFWKEENDPLSRKQYCCGRLCKIDFTSVPEPSCNLLLSRQTSTYFPSVSSRIFVFPTISQRKFTSPAVLQLQYFRAMSDFNLFHAKNNYKLTPVSWNAHWIHFSLLAVLKELVNWKTNKFTYKKNIMSMVALKRFIRNKPRTTSVVQKTTLNKFHVNC